MRLHTVLLWWVSTLLTSCAFGLELDERALGVADVIANVPPCGLACLLQTVPAAGCSLVDTECQCGSEALAYSTAACILANCTMSDSLGTAKVQAQLCNVSHESKSGVLFVSMTVVYAIVCLFVALRFAARCLTKRVRVDDWLILAALAFTTATWISALEMTRYNFGKHVWDLEEGQLAIALKFFYVSWNLYVITLGLVKASLIAFYLQIFQERRFRIVCWAVLGFIAVSTIIIQFLTIFACTPVQSFWDRDIKGKCLDVGAIGFANSALAITQDLIILIMPMPSLFRLQLKFWRKIAVALMFAVGAFGCITTVIRLHALAGFKISLDPTWDYVNVVVWTGAELAAGIVCASLPAVRQLLTIVLPSRFQKFVTNRSRSRTLPGGKDRGQTSSLQQRGKDHSASSGSGHSASKTWGVKTNISASSRARSQAEIVQDIERGQISAEQQEGGSTTRRPRITGFKAIASTEGRETVGRQSDDDQLELLQSPCHTYQPGTYAGRGGEEITALPRMGILPDRSDMYEPKDRGGL
ncbi:hypothetical protein B5807_09398 [Epicoccum nigrum]|uniref:CFEM domain-containing protein n=1 Tax=Epicoccum nigrum TaxID=105696 RepID=A0A1Y2LMC2_EPING|nr:hypothetical protein B5807_09398 [Epicoccum nigrum]